MTLMHEPANRVLRVSVGLGDRAAGPPPHRLEVTQVIADWDTDAANVTWPDFHRQ
jgi:hypothetical protein